MATVVATGAGIGLMAGACAATQSSTGEPLASAAATSSASVTPSASSLASATPSSAGSASRSPAISLADYVDLMDLAGPGLGLVAVEAVTRGSVHAGLVVSADYGRTFAAIGPATPTPTIVDSVFFLNRSDGWLAVFNTGSTAETLYRTTDGARTWQAFAAFGHGIAAGSADTVQFVTPERGWLVLVDSAGPVDRLYATTDGGARWRLVASAEPETGSSHLPEGGQVLFEPDGTGWLGGGPYSTSLFRTADGGRTWRRAAIRAPSGSIFGLPAVFGPTLIEPVTAGPTLLLYRSTDAGQRWSKLSELAPAGARECEPGLSPASLPPPTVSLPAPAVGWAAAVRSGRTVIYRTTDGGQLWDKIAMSWPVPSGTCEAPVVQAIGASHAWVLTPGTDHIYATSDGGASWQRIDTTAVAADARG